MISENHVKTLKINKLLILVEKLKLTIEGKSRQTSANKQTFDFCGKIEIERKSRQNAANKQTVDILLIYMPNHCWK